MRVFFGIVFNRGRSPPIRIAFAQNRVDGAALDPVVTGPDGRLLVVGWFIRIVRQVVSPCLQFRDSCLQLGDGGADIGQLDNVGISGLGDFAQLGQRVTDPL